MKDDGSKATLRYKTKHSTVSATVYGPRIGWRWCNINYFRWVVSTTDPGKWETRAPDREVDQPHLLKCVKDVQQFLKEREEFQQDNYGVKC